MDNLTHSLVGALLGQAGLKKKTGLAMPALIIGANLPDVDAACFFWLEGAEHLGFRRGITHGPPALVLLPLILAGLLYGFDRWQAKRGKRPEDRLPVSFQWLFLLSFIGCLTHPALDWLNVYGIRLLEPFSSQWFYGDTLFIIDVWLWALMGFATWFSFRREKRGGEWKRPARAAIAVALAYIGVNGALSAQSAADYPKEQHFFHSAVSSPVPLKFWEREVIGFVEGGPFVWDVGVRKWTLAQGLSDHETPIGNADFLFGIECVSAKDLQTDDREVRAFLFWSRIPIMDTQEDGSVLLRDARFYDPRARDRFTVALPDVKCDPPK
ncbi:metal-dependent hydrolase [Qipengyuania sp. 1NDH17]|uniref:Metal-dependent hydrolase n=1 Tax=Qipengyuania polymorpha TaxID=2867234 RepID=A0ABS7IVM0_9SPHN|nr:metal-dependent hydrolase [Qipengyuania polymorpha]MBX7457516.1 metal-dependent hydrolase [Qipengyuania polymorpha]